MESLGLSPNPLRGKALSKECKSWWSSIAYPQCSSSANNNIVGISSHTNHSINHHPCRKHAGPRDSQPEGPSFVEARTGNGKRPHSSCWEPSGGAQQWLVQECGSLSGSDFSKWLSLSVGSFHSLPMEERVEPALELLHKD